MLKTIKKSYQNIFIIIAPPRSTSTALARVFWEHADTAAYCHEPFDIAYHHDGSLRQVLAALNDPLRVRRGGQNLVIKEMTFQVGEHFEMLADLTARPLIFNIRDPRLAIMSRLRKRRASGLDDVFPPYESGWLTLRDQINHCQRHGVPYVLLDSTQYRNSPETILKQLFKRLGLSFSEDMLRWRPQQDMQLGGLEDLQQDWYRRVLNSKGLEAASEVLPDEAQFPAQLRDHLQDCLAIYRELFEDEAMITVKRERHLFKHATRTLPEHNRIGL